MNYRHLSSLLFTKARNTRVIAFFIPLLATLIFTYPGNASGVNIETTRISTKIGDYLAGRHAQHVQDSTSAIRFFRSALFNNPNHIALTNQTFSMMVFSGKIKEAIPLAEKLYKTKQANFYLSGIVLALKDIRAGNFNKAAEKLRWLPKSSISRFALTLINAWSLASKRKFVKAIGDLEQKMINPGTTAFFAPHAGFISEYANKPGKAEKYYKDARFHRQAGVNNIRLLGNLYERTGQIDNAKILYQNYIQTTPRTSIFDQALERVQASKHKKRRKLILNEGIAESLFSLSEAVKRQNPYQGIIFARLALFVNPEFSFAKLNLADDLSREGNLEEALSLYKVITRDPIYRWIARLRVAQTYNFMDKIKQAKIVLERLADEKDTRIEALVDLGTMYRNRKRYKEAVKTLERAKKRVKKWKTRHWVLLYRNAASLERLGRWPAAEKDFLRALELSPNQPAILNYLGYTWVEKGKNLKRAREMIEKAFKQRPQAAHIVDSLGWVQFMTGKISDAVINLERAVSLDPADPTINDHLGDAYWKVGRRLEARYQWQRALSLQPEKNLIPIINDKIKSGIPSTNAKTQTH